MEAFSALLTICAGNSPVTGEFPAQRPVTRSCDVILDLRLYKRLSINNRDDGYLRRYRAHYDVTIMSDRQVATTEDIVWFHFIRIVHINTVVFTGYAGASSGTVAGCTGAVAFQAVLADWVDVISLVTFIGAQISLPAEKRKMTMKAHKNSPALLKNGVWIIRHCLRQFI